jgi:hypothetical protein
LHARTGITDSFLGKLTDGILSKTNIAVYIYHPFQPISTIRRHIVIVPENAEYEVGFSFWLSKIWNLALNSGAKIVFYSTWRIINLVENIQNQHPIEVEFNVLNNWNDTLLLMRNIRKDDNLAIVLSRRENVSYQPAMAKIPPYLNRHFLNQNFLLIFPMQSAIGNDEIDLTNSSLLETIEGIDVIGKTIATIFRKR